LPLGTVDSVEDYHVTHSLNAIRRGSQVVPNAAGKGVQLQRELIDGLEFSYKPLTRNLSREPPLFFERKRR